MIIKGFNYDQWYHLTLRILNDTWLHAHASLLRQSLNLPISFLL